ncbi:MULTISPECIES: oxygenase MpaB family protein [unclassified Gordonia (in: high G+C Gram-positive bacteria)]|uniref:oxygenase MpaB family protein n=1 Tax=unclassified Gordonia (in: high G+C Gram-positive bacteria) TaxID=2657482 RepID=UPI001F107E95|nr:oxygenase MpaB family protein [Gordonia sp. ABSL49_1]MCH5643215.1 oxygenase MpaB family protein [Gordonia sp. ABSL49_1]
MTAAPEFIDPPDVVDTYQHDLVAAIPRARRRRPIRQPADLVTGLGPTIAGANVIMQLANPKVGYGVNESRVDSGNAIKRPIKRGRTTGTFLAVALLGNADDQAYVHREVGRIHQQVYSTAQSPVRYSASDARLQLWVAVCLLKYFIDQYELLYGPLSAREKELVVRMGHPLGTALNVPVSKWPHSYDALIRYWNDEVTRLRIDPPVREELQSLSDLSFLEYRVGRLGTLAHVTLGSFLTYVISGGLPEEVRDLMGWEWTERDARRYRATLAGFRLVDPILGPVVKGMLHLNLLDLRVRRRLGLRVF